MVFKALGVRKQKRVAPETFETNKVNTMIVPTWNLGRVSRSWCKRNLGRAHENTSGEKIKL